MSLKIAGIIPARYNSTRFPGKPLADIFGKPMIRRVYEQAVLCKLIHLTIVATDDQRIYDTVLSFGGRAILTSSLHQTGTDRLAEALDHLNKDFDVVINIQGDEPFIKPSQIETLIGCFNDPQCEIATLVKKIKSNEELFDLNSPKVVIGKNKQAIYFSRNPIPFIRGIEKENWLHHHSYYKHIGIYGYRNDILKKIAGLAQSSLEKAENLEQLRWIENGYKIFTAETNEDSYSVDVPGDIEKLKSLL